LKQLRFFLGLVAISISNASRVIMFTQGAQYDGFGRFVNWWTSEDLTRWRNKTQVR
jgi:hypothetical protein